MMGSGEGARPAWEWARLVQEPRASSWSTQARSSQVDARLYNMLCWKGALKRPLAGVALLVTSQPETHCTDGPREGLVPPSSTSWSVLGGLNCLTWNPVCMVGGVPWTPQTEGPGLCWTEDVGMDKCRPGEGQGTRGRALGW